MHEGSGEPQSLGTIIPDTCPCLNSEVTECACVLQFGKKTAPAPKLTTVEPEPSYAIPATLAGIATLSFLSGAKVPAAISGILGLFLAIQVGLSGNPR